MITAFTIPHEIHELPLGAVFLYILGEFWGKVPELKASGDNCDSVHYEKPIIGKDEGEND